MACSSTLSQSSFPCSALSVVSSMIEDDVEGLSGVIDISEDVVQCSAQEHIQPPKAQQSNNFTSQLNSPIIFAAEKRELHVSNGAGTPTNSFNHTTSLTREKCIRPSPIVSKYNSSGRGSLRSADESPYNGHLNLRRLWVELGIPVDEQDAVLSCFSEEKQSDEEYNHYIDKLTQLANHRRLYISITLLYERLTTEVASSICSLIVTNTPSTKTKDLTGVLVLLGIYRLLLMALMALTEMVRDICTIPISLPYLNAKDARGTSSIKKLLDTQLLSPERVYALLSITGQSVDLLSIEDFFLRCDAMYGACIAQHAFLISCIPTPLIDIMDATLVDTFAQYFHLIISTTDTMVNEMEKLLRLWTERLNLSKVNISILASLANQFQPDHYVFMAIKEEKLISNLEMRLDEMQLRASTSIFFTIPIYKETNQDIITAEHSSSRSDAPSAPLLVHSSSLRDNV